MTIYNSKCKWEKWICKNFSLFLDYWSSEKNETGMIAWIRHDTGSWVGWPVVTGFAVQIWRWGFSFGLAGRTLGMGLVGLRVVTRDGDPITNRQSFIRTIVFPFSMMILFLGFLGLFTSPERRSMHDAAAGSVVVIDWGDRPAEIPAPLTRWVANREADEPDDEATPTTATE